MAPAATAGRVWSLDVYELTRNSVPTGDPALVNRCPKTPLASLSYPRPHDDEVSVAIRPDVGIRLILVGVGIDQELGADRRSGAVELLAEDAGAAAVLCVVACPHDDEFSRAAQRDGGILLRVARVRVDLELGADRAAGAVEALAEDAAAVSVLILVSEPLSQTTTNSPPSAQATSGMN